MVIKSHAKINLSLLVKKKLPNGLHDLESLFCKINLFDTISIKKVKNKKKDKISFFGPHSKNVINSNNSINKVLKLLRKKKLIANYYSIKVNKKIPVFAGFGGGTSNAFAVLKFMTKNKIKKNIFSELSKSVGSDLSLFYYHQGYLKNLKKIVKLDKVHKLYFLIVYPKIICSTKEIFSKVNKIGKKKIFKINDLKNKRSFIDFIVNSNNDLQSIVEKKHPIIRNLLRDIYNKEGCYLSRLTGSGSGCYGLFPDQKCSKVALKVLRKKYPKFWFSIAKTI